MIRSINFPTIILLTMWRSQSILGVDVNLNVGNAEVCVGKNITLTCKIDPFTSPISASWSRNGSSSLTTCTNFGSCTLTIVTINDIKYYFVGSSTGIQVSFQVPDLEDGIEWICSHNAIPYRYTFNISNTCTTPTTTTTTTISTPTTATTPSTSPHTCIFFKEKSCGFNYSILAILVLLCIAPLFVKGYLLKGKRNRRQQKKSGKETNKTHSQRTEFAHNVVYRHDK